MDVLSDYRILWMFLIPIVLNIYFFILRKNKNKKKIGSWQYQYYNEPDFSDFNIVESLISFALFFAVMSGLWYWGRDARISNYKEQIGGYITAVYTKDGSHDHSYDCMCTTDKDGVSHCQTCHETIYHRDFFVETNIGDWFGQSKWSDRVDKPCKTCEPYSIPAYYSQSFVGKGISLENHYPNYIAAMNEKEYRNTYDALSTGLKDVCPEEPNHRVTDQSVQKAFALGFDADSPVKQNINSWNFANAPVDLSNLNFQSIPLYMDTEFGYLGNVVQGDTHLYVVNSTNIEYANMCMAKWKNGAKNAIYVFIFGQSNGTDYFPTDVYVGLGVDGIKKNTGLEQENESERSNEYMKFDIRSQLMTYFNNGGTLDRRNVLSVIFENVNKSFVRQEMASFKGLIHYVYPTSAFMTLIFIVMFVMDVGVHIGFSNNKI